MVCPTHGNQKYAFVCQHLLGDKKNQGFWEPFESKQEADYEDGELNAWCNICDDKLMEEGEWNDTSEAFANIQLICRSCFFEIKSKNKLNLHNNG